MTTLIDSGKYLESDLCINIKQWLTDSKELIKFDGRYPDIHIAGNIRIDETTPCILLTPISSVNYQEKSYSNQVDRYSMNILVTLVVDYYPNFIMSQMLTWGSDVRTVLNGSLAFTTQQATGGSATTIVNSLIVNKYPNDYYNGWRMTFTDGTGNGHKVIITDYVGSTGTFTFVKIPTGLDEHGAPNPDIVLDSTSVYTLEQIKNLWLTNSYLYSGDVSGVNLNGVVRNQITSNMEVYVTLLFKVVKILDKIH